MDNQNSNNLSNVDNSQKSEDLINNNKSKIPLDNYKKSNIINVDYKGLSHSNTLNKINKNIPQVSYNNSNNKRTIANNLHINNQRIKSITEYFSFPPKIGLQNLGAACYMNATLQCFYNILHFVDFFKFNSKVGEIIS